MESEERHFEVIVDGDVVLGKQMIEFEFQGEFIASMKSFGHHHTECKLTLSADQFVLLRQAVEDVVEHLSFDEVGRLIADSKERR